MKIGSQLVWLLFLAVPVPVDAADRPTAEELAGLDWPPRMSGVESGTVSMKLGDVLNVPMSVALSIGNEGVASFVVAKEPPTIDLAFQQKLGAAPAARRLWSSWGDICLAKDGGVYLGIGDHGHDADGDARCFLYHWDSLQKLLTQIVDMNDVVTPRPGQPAWSKVHAKIDEGLDGKIYFCCTLNAGNRAGDAKYQWTESLPGAQLYQFDPATGQTRVFANLPPKRCTATSLFDEKRNVWWCNLEAGSGDALYGVDLSTKQIVYQSVDGAVAFNRNFALASDGSIHFNGVDGAIHRLDPMTKQIVLTGVTFEDSPGMRASTRQANDGSIYGVTHKTNQLFRYRPNEKQIELLGPTWLTGEYTTVMELSPDERFVYYLPGAHGKAWQYGTPVIQYELATGTRKVLAFLAETFEQRYQYVPGGTYGIKLSSDGSTLYVNFNGHAADPLRPASMKPIGFGLCSFVAIHIPKSER